MSRSGYCDDNDDILVFGRWRGMVASSIRGKRGQAFIREMLAALDAMPEQRLIADALEADGEVCAIGAVGKARGIDMRLLDPEDGDGVAAAFDISRALALEIVYMNDEAFERKTPEERWLKMREWIAGKIRPSHPREGGR